MIKYHTNEHELEYTSKKPRSIGSAGRLSSRNLDDDFAYGATADHLFVRLENIFESVHGVDAVFYLACKGSEGSNQRQGK